MRSRSLFLALGQLAWHFNPAAATPYQARVHETGSYFPAPADYGTWLMAFYLNGNARASDLVSIQTSNTATGTVQVRAAGYDNYYYARLTDQKTTTAFPAQNYGVWQLADFDRDGKLDLVYIQDRNTASGKVEVKVASGSSAFQTLILQTKTVFDAQINGHWQLVDMDGDGKLDLVYIQNSNTASSKVEIQVASGASGFASVTKKAVTTFDIGNDGTWQMVNYDRDQTPDLAYVQNINTSSGYVEITIASGASNYQTIVQSVPSSYTVENDGVWKLVDWDQGGVPDLVYIKTTNTGSGTVEVHVALG